MDAKEYNIFYATDCTIKMVNIVNVILLFHYNSKNIFTTCY